MNATRTQFRASRGHSMDAMHACTASIEGASCTDDCKQGRRCTCAAVHGYPLPRGAKPLRFAPGAIEFGKQGWEYSISVGECMLLIVAALSLAMSFSYIGVSLGWF